MVVMDQLRTHILSTFTGQGTEEPLHVPSPSINASGKPEKYLTGLTGLFMGLAGLFQKSSPVSHSSRA
jgi:hypothetical protein